MSQGLVARDAQGLKLLILAGSSPCCPLSHCLPAGRAGIEELGCCLKKKKSPKPSFPSIHYFWNRCKLTEQDENTNLCSATAPQGWGTSLRASVSPTAKHHTGTNVTSTALSASFPAPARRQTHRATGIHNKTHLHFPTGTNPRPPPACIQLRVYVLLPGKQEARYHAEGDSRAISEICYPHALNKIKLKVLLCCQDKGQTGEIIFHSQTLNYSLRLYQIQSENK